MSEETAKYNVHQEDDIKSDLPYATIPKKFLIIASREKFNGSVWAVYAYMTMNMDLKTGNTRKLLDTEICEALGISNHTLRRAKKVLRDHGLIVHVPDTIKLVR